MNVLITCIVFSTLLYSAYTDYKSRIIPDRVHVVFFFLGVLGIINEIIMNTPWMIIMYEHGLGIIIPFCMFMGLALINSECIGGGDIKLLTALSFVLGLSKALTLIIIACLFGIVYGLVTKNKQIPLAVFIFLAFVFYTVTLMVLQ